MKTRYTKLVLMLAALFMAVQATAVLPLTATRSSNFTFFDSPTTIPLDADGTTTLAFNTTENNQRVTVSYRAECGALGTAEGQWVDIDILVDGVASTISGTGASDAFCNTSTDAVSPVEFSANYGWKRAVMNAEVTVPSVGDHTVQVVGKLQAGATQGWLSDTSLIVWR